MIFETWGKVRPFLLPSIAETHGTHTEDDVILMWLGGKCRLWPGDKAALITEVNIFPQMKVMNVWLGGGDLSELLEMEPAVCAYARETGCRRVTGGGRVGWGRVLKDYRAAGNFMYKDL